MRRYIKRITPVLIFKKILLKKLMPGMFTVSLITTILCILHLSLINPDDGEAPRGLPRRGL